MSHNDQKQNSSPRWMQIVKEADSKSMPPVPIAVPTTPLTVRSTSSVNTPIDKTKSGIKSSLSTTLQSPIQDDGDKVQLFALKAKIVGKQYYSGRMNDGEIVHLVREPHNPYGKSDEVLVRVRSCSSRMFL